MSDITAEDNIDELEKFNSFLIKVATDFEGVRIRRKMLELQRIINAFKTKEGIEGFQIADVLGDYSTDDIIDYLFERELRREILESYLDKYAVDDIVEVLKAQYRTEDILEELDEDKIVDYLSNDYFIADNEKKAVELLEDGGYLDIPFSNNKNILNFRKSDCIELLEKITSKDGWNNIYDILLIEKDRLHII